MQIVANKGLCSSNYECDSGQCDRNRCFDAKLSCSATKSCAAGLICSRGKCVSKLGEKCFYDNECDLEQFCVRSHFDFSEPGICRGNT